MRSSFAGPAALMRRQTRGVLAVFAGLALTAAAGAQASRPVFVDGAQETRPRETTAAAESRPVPSADELLAALDARVYVAGDQGLASLRFRYRPKSEGVLESAPFWVAVTWRAGAEAAVTFVGADGKPLAELPPLLRQPGAKDQPAYRERMEQGAKAYVRLFVGRSYRETYAGWHRRVEERVVNGRDERTIVLEPSRAGRFRRVEFALDPRGVPWRITNWESRAAAADSVVQLPVFEEFTVTPLTAASRPAGAEPIKRLVMSSWKETRGEVTDQVVVSYQRIDGLLVPASHERISKVEVGNSKTVFEDVVVNR